MQIKAQEAAARDPNVFGSRSSRNPPISEALSLTVQDAVRLAGLSRTAIFDAVRAGHLASTKVGGRRLIMAASLRKLIGAEEAQ
jgi:excisionase family DNA binding protein